MRCYFMEKGHISAVEILTPGEDASLIEQSKAAFDRHPRKAHFQGFEVWDGTRCLYRFPEDESP